MDVNVQAKQPIRPAGPQASNGRKPENGSKLPAAIVSLVVLLALVIGGLFIWKSQGDSGKLPAVNKDGYQAVFLTNGQVYFGNLTGIGGEYAELTNIYYLQVQSQPQTSGDQAAASQVNDTNSQVSLTKLGSELHGPTDKMNIAKDQILFWEDLKNDSSVVKAITEHKKKQD